MKNPKNGGNPAIDNKINKIFIFSNCWIETKLFIDFIETLLSLKIVTHMNSMLLYKNRINIQNIFTKNIEDKIQAPVKIEEIIKIFFTLHWNRDINTLRIKARKIKNSNKEKYICLIKYKGKIFCQDEVKKNSIQSISIIKLNNHKWKGGIPIFQHKLNEIKR